MPQITKSAETASRMLATMREPVERVAPALTQLADTLNNPMMTDLPRRLSETMDVLSSIPRALSPLGQVADLAGGFFGTRGLGSFGGTGRAIARGETERRTPRRGGRGGRGGRAAARPTTMVQDCAERPGHLPPLGRQAPGAEGARTRQADDGEEVHAARNGEGRGEEGAGQANHGQEGAGQRPGHEGAGQGDHGEEGRSPEGRGQEGVRHPIGPVNRPSLKRAG